MAGTGRTLARFAEGFAVLSLCVGAAQAQEADQAQGDAAPQQGFPTLPDGPGKTFTVGPERTPPSVLAILAHPDDEMTIAPVLSRIRREGGKVTIAFATSGDAGPGVSGMEPGEALATLREGEARCSAFALGLDEPIFWRFGDGTLALAARNSDEEMRDLAGRIASLIELEEPTVVMTWGPDGGYGHADHRTISNAVSQVVQAMGPGRPDLLYAAVPTPSQDTPMLPGFEAWATLHPSLITDRIRYEFADLEATRIAVDCYESQFPAEARAALPGLLHDRIWRGTVYFRLAFSRAD